MVGGSSVPVPNASCGLCATYPSLHQPFWDGSAGSPCRKGAEGNHGGGRNAGRRAAGGAGAVCAVHSAPLPGGGSARSPEPLGGRTDGPPALPAGGVRSRGGPHHGYPGEDLRDREGNRPHPEEQRCRGLRWARGRGAEGSAGSRLWKGTWAGRALGARYGPPGSLRAPSAALRVPAVGAGSYPGLEFGCLHSRQGRGAPGQCHSALLLLRPEAVPNAGKERG